MNLVTGIVILIVGIFIGYAICMTSWVKELSHEMNEIDTEIAKIHSKIESEKDIQEKENEAKC